MKSDVIQYESIYHRLKNKIECGILPVGARLPGRSVLCREFGTSERTIRRVLELLEQDGFLEILPKRRPTVISAFPRAEDRMMQNTKHVDADKVNDLMQSAALLCYPIYMQGLQMCDGGDWQIPENILRNMDPDIPAEFWQRSSRLWRFFIARNGNELLLRAVDCLGFRGKEPPHGSREDRLRYRAHVETLFQTVKGGGAPRSAELDAIFSQYRAIAEQAGEMQFLQAGSPCPMLAAAESAGQRLRLAQERYSTMCLDLLGMIAIGRYQPGDRLPTHDQLTEYYGVSRDTSVKAVRMLQEWGVVTAAPQRGISVEMDLEALQRIQITPESIAHHVRRYLDSLELLVLTVEWVAAHAAEQVEPKEALRLKEILLRQREQPCEHQLIPRILLDFITEHIRYEALRSIYQVLTHNFSIGRSIPKLLSRDLNDQNRIIYRICISAADILSRGDADLFAKEAAGMFDQIRQMIVAACRQLGYWDAAMEVYDGTSLWK